MKCVVRLAKGWTAGRGGSHGQLLIEVLIALAILGLIATVFIGAMYTSLQAARVTDERSTALTIAKAQIEFVKARPYSESEWQYTVRTAAEGGATADPGEEPDWWDPDDVDNPLPPPLEAEYEGYWVTVSSQPDDLDDDGTLDENIRRITAIVYNRADEEVLRLENHEIPR